MHCTAVLIEISSIQSYIFGSNKLREIVGASYLVDEVFNSILFETVDSILGLSEKGFREWEKNPDLVQIKNNGVKFEVGYIGGGNALLFFKEEKKAKEFIKEWTKKLLIETPGLVPVVAYNTFNLNEFKNSRNEIFSLLQNNKNRFLPRTIISRHGITGECPRSGYSMEVWNEGLPDENQGYVSSSINAKLDASKKSLDKFNQKYSSVLKNRFCFTNKIDSLGQRLNEKENYISIAHIDGNEMGAKFQAIETLENTRKLSVALRNATEKSFRDMISELIQNFEPIQSDLGYTDNIEKEHYPKENGKIVLPIRPIIVGGDDITFVSHGKLGIYLSQLFMKKFSSNIKDEAGKKYSVCAGVFVSKTKYPFHYGYKRAEELCSHAKKMRHAASDSGSWIDFHISYGGISGSIEEVRKNQYQVPEGDLLLRPYKTDSTADINMDLVIKKTKKMKNDILRSKMISLRKLLYSEKSKADAFVRDLDVRKQELPHFNGHNFHRNIWEKGKTPYFDMIELTELYPFSVI